jgi:hypothetical protein
MTWQFFALAVSRHAKSLAFVSCVTLKVPTISLSSLAGFSQFGFSAWLVSAFA